MTDERKIDGKRVLSIKCCNGSDGKPFLFAVTEDKAFYYSWSIVVIKWEPPVYDRASL